jgi:cell division protein FtsI/penicillin-binding protein 2
MAFGGDLAIAVLVEKGRSGGTVAAPIARRFLEAI